ncbi:MAG: molybdenum ABC transporter ATP-binding protein [Gammaproteobacteria bacterium]|nr:molybdenum ABC transporter ATP-binding protein [Gammaproteobacteria bacterium]MBT5204796.1 molybdenum ABC transporter ATP-binding protein [Gammaproteobacteria bacterium]MBT5603935.1 molybdenum ABC transporter ATP-binding protein [Gammaproteobacteria bacterium]MBT6245704.1 molybdenum ABC transporter ATP-binding protein [Gammaproteobacteria bacterium]
MNIQAQIEFTRPSGFSLNTQLKIGHPGVTAIYGQSGAGKSTLLRILAGLEHGNHTDKINITVDEHIWQNQDQFLLPEKRAIGVVFQDQHLFPHLSVQDNLLFALKRQHSPSSISLENIIAWFELGPLLNQKVSLLSGGESQRAAIARVIINAPKIILMDEPLASLDYPAKQRILNCLKILKEEFQIPILYVSHQWDEITQIADEVQYIDSGRITHKGDIATMSTSFELGLYNGDSAAAVIYCKVIRQDSEYGLTQLKFEQNDLFVNQLERSPGETVRLIISARDTSLVSERPEASSILNILEATVDDFLTEDRTTLVRLHCGQQNLLARITRKSADAMQIRKGQQLFAQIKATALTR